MGGIGRGGHGKVYKAFDPLVRRNVAIKMLIAENDRDLLVRFEQAPGANALPELVDRLVDEGRHLPQSLTAADAVQEVAEDCRTLGRVADFGMELQAVNRLALVANGGHGASVGGGQGHEIAVGHLHLVAVKLAGQLGLKDGYRLVINCKESAGQTVPHLHLHLLGGRPMHWPPG